MRDTSARIADRGLSIAHIEPASASEWDDAWEGCDFSTYFHSRTWSELWTLQDPETLFSTGQLVVFSDGRRAVLPLTLHKRGHGWLESYAASAGGMFGGWISRDALRAEHAALLTDHLLFGMHANVSWRVNPYDPNKDVIQRTLEGQCVWLDWGDTRQAKALQAIMHLRRPLAFADQTHTIDLEHDYCELSQNKTGVMRDAKKATRAGISIEQADTLSQWRDYYGVYLASVERWGSDPGSAYPPSLFEAMFELHSPRVKLSVALHENKIVSGALCLYAKQHVVYWHGASLSEYLPMGPAKLLMLEIMRDARERGYRWYDFNPSGHAAGVTEFKKRFRPRELECPLVYVDGPVKRMGRTLMLGLGR